MYSSWEPKKSYVDDNYEEICRNLTVTEGSQKPTRRIAQEDESFLRECAKIGAFLMDKNAVMPLLKKLNKLLIEEAAARGETFEKSEDGPYIKHNKILREVVERELDKLGFYPELGKALALISPNAFLDSLDKKLLIKDPGAGIEHGEFTHAIQWLLIGWQYQATRFLNYPPAIIVKELGNPKYTFQSGTGFGLWDGIVDRFDDPESHKYPPAHEYDFRYPEILQKVVLSSSDPELSLLRTLFESRATKRALEKKSSSLADDSPFKQNTSQKTRPKKEYEPSKKDKNLLLPRTKSTK